MVRILLSGGLGNQLFQYAFGRYYAFFYKTGFALDLSKFSIDSKLITKRNYELDFFDNPCLLVTSSPVPRYHFIFSNLFLANYFKINYFYREKSTKFDNNIFRYGPNIIADGYWQSFKYFQAISRLIISDIDTHKPLSKLSKETLDLILSYEGAVSIHVRRGDFIENSAAFNFHGVLPLAYYNDLISKISNLINCPYFFIFSDDPSWCRENLKLNSSNVTFVTHNLGNDSWQDLILMSYCRHHIIANSSFSWWGAWLADQRFGENRLVFAPKKWFLASEFSPEDRFPKHWMLS